MPETPATPEMPAPTPIEAAIAELGKGFENLRPQEVAHKARDIAARLPRSDRRLLGEKPCSDRVKYYFDIESGDRVELAAATLVEFVLRKIPSASS